MKAIELFGLNIQRSEELLEVHKNSYPHGRPTQKGPAADLLRAVIVFSMAALDAYIHRRIVEAVKRVLTLRKRVPEKCIDQISKKFKEKDGYREILNLSIQKNPENRILRLLNESLSPMTFQKPEQIKLLFEMAELQEETSWKQINRFLKNRPGKKKKGRKRDAKSILLSLADRRNDIVHEADMYFSKKYQGKIKSINRKEVRDDLGKLRRIVLAIEKISEIS